MKTHQRIAKNLLSKRKCVNNMVISNTCKTMILVASLFLFNNCSKQSDLNPTPTTFPTNVSEVYSLKFQSEKIEEFLQIESSGQKQEIAVEKISNLFGKRVEQWRPKTLLFKGDSLTINKDNSIEEHYKIKWETNQLFLYNNATEEWQYCGEKNTNGKFILNSAFYSKSQSDDFGKRTVSGQEYFIKNYTDLISSENATNLIWLKAQFIYE